MKKVAVIIPNYNTKQITLECVNSLLKVAKTVSLSVVIVDNASTDGSDKVFTSLEHNHKNVHFIKNKANLGYSGAINIGIKSEKADYYLILNSDTIFFEDTIGKSVAWMEKHPLAGIVGCKLLNSDMTFQPSGGFFPTTIRVFFWMLIQDMVPPNKLVKNFHPKPNDPVYSHEGRIDWVTGAFFLVKADVINTVGLFDERYFMYTEEVDYCYRAALVGWQTWYVPEAGLIHLGGASAESSHAIVSEADGVKKFYKKYYLLGDYLLLRLMLVIGFALRIMAFWVLGNTSKVTIYTKAIKHA